MLESWEGDMILSIARPLPAGLHLYQMLDGKTTTYKVSCYLYVIFTADIEDSICKTSWTCVLLNTLQTQITCKSTAII